MDFLSKVWDGSKGAVGDNLGYYGCMAVACENDSDNDTPERKILPPREIRPYFQKQLSHLLKPTKAHFALYLQGRRLFVVGKNGGCPAKRMQLFLV